MDGDADIDTGDWIGGIARAEAEARRKYVLALTPERAARTLEGLLSMRGEWIGRDDPACAAAVREGPIDLVPDAFRELAVCLDALRIPYVIIGGIAASLQGQPRYTSDVDLIIALPNSRLDELARAARERGFTFDPELVRIQWLASGFGRIWFGTEATGVAVDLMPDRSDFPKSVLWRAEAIRFAGVRARMASPEDLILLKCMAWRYLDVGDIDLVLMRHGNRIDRAYLRKWAAEIARTREDQADLPARIDGILGDGPLPPPRRATDPPLRF